MEPCRLPRQTLLGEIAYAERPVGPPKLKFKDGVKRDMISLDIKFSDWKDLAKERDQWRKVSTRMAPKPMMKLGWG
ncbi:unnamed protein product [Arctia plantaginis]|uniref:Uncharacterized protein n=1 Tax=Arctia plantaginis TaxID=874455 RepID=A0A8S1AEG8_ARCPL|nr:unnamed protein product [Arctia plantaginis]